MTPKELYELAKAAGAENYEIKVGVSDGSPYYPILIDCIEHGEEIIAMTAIQDDK